MFAKGTRGQLHHTPRQLITDHRPRNEAKQPQHSSAAVRRHAQRTTLRQQTGRSKRRHLALCGTLVASMEIASAMEGTTDDADNQTQGMEKATSNTDRWSVARMKRKCLTSRHPLPKRQGDPFVWTESLCWMRANKACVPVAH